MLDSGFLVLEMGVLMLVMDRPQHERRERRERTVGFCFLLCPFGFGSLDTLIH